MRVREVIRVLLTLYLWGFITYQLLPFQIIPYTNYAPKELNPKPVIYPYTFAYDVKTSFSSHAGSIKNLLKAGEEKGFDLIFGDFPDRIGDKLFPTPKSECYTIRSSEVSLPKRVMHFMFESVPKTLTGVRPEDVLMRGFYGVAETCYLVAHDDRVLFSTFLGLEVPTYGHILDGKKNLYLSRDVLIHGTSPEDFLKGAIVLFGDREVRVFAYSDRSFYLPGDRTVYPFRIVVSADLENPLILLYHEDKLRGIYAQRRINLKVSAKGRYTVQVLTYKFKIHIFHFGLRTVALSTPITLM
ncbi:MAG: hypothetical protein GXO18_00710 [Aquificae bacterium]|nr:hypothetical protein [Aquificota bacterium]